MAPATVPSPAAVAPGVWGVGLPFPNPLVFAYGYLWRGPDGVILIDSGWDSDECWHALAQGLDRAAVSWSDVVGVVVTHVHPDHYGLAGRVRDVSGAWIGVHPAERPRIAAGEADRAQLIDDLIAWFAQAGASASEREALVREELDIRANVSMVQPDVDLTDGAAVPCTGGRLQAVHTPGHTPGHLCFRDPTRNLLFTGDHVLPRITPNVSKRPGSDEDPLRDYVSSLANLRACGDPLVLPGHEWTFDRLGTRLDTLMEHHDERLDDIQLAVRDGASTVWEVAQAVQWSRPFARLTGTARRSALGETHSHLHRLVEVGRLRCARGIPDRFAVAAGASAAARA